MTMANRVTLCRIGMIPLFVATYYLCTGPLSVAPILLFLLASLSDTLDGYLARSRNEVTVFGQFMDPIADKLLVMSAFVVLVDSGRLSAVSAIMFLSREFIISGFRLVAASRNVVMAAGKLGKIKTVTQIVAILLLLMGNWPFRLLFLPLDRIAVGVALFFTIWSGADYLIKHWALLFSSEA